MPSSSVSNWSALAVDGQLSWLSKTPSESVSMYGIYILTSLEYTGVHDGLVTFALMYFVSVNKPICEEVRVAALAPIISVKFILSFEICH